MVIPIQYIRIFLRKPLRKNMELPYNMEKESELPQLTQWTH